MNRNRMGAKGYNQKGQRIETARWKRNAEDFSNKMLTKHQIQNEKAMKEASAR